MSDEHDELQMLYQASGRDTWESKRQQWSITYYALLVHAALIGLYNYTKPVDLSGQLLFVGLAVLMTGYGFWYLVSSQRSLVKFRKRAQAIRRRFSDAFKQCYGQEEPKRVSPFKDFSFLLGKMLAMSAGAMAVCWVVFGNLLSMLLAGTGLLIVAGVSIGYLHQTESVFLAASDTTRQD